PRDDRCKTRGQDGSLFLSCRALSSPTTCRFIPALRPALRGASADQEQPVGNGQTPPAREARLRRVGRPGGLACKLYPTNCFSIFSACERGGSSGVRVMPM